MTTATMHHRRPSLSALNMLIAVAAIVIAVFALVTAPAEVSSVVSQSPSADVGAGTEEIPSVLVPAPTATLFNVGTPLLEGCEQHVAFQRC